MKKSPIKNMAYWKAKSGAAPLKQMVNNPNTPVDQNMPIDPNKKIGPNATIEERVDAKVEEKVDEVVNQKTNEGLV
jgi:hypothetical protein